MAVSTVDYTLLGGMRFATEKHNFNKFHLPAELSQIQAVRSESPFLDGVLTGFDAGILAADLNDRGNWYRDALGMEPTGPDGALANPWLKCGKQIVSLGLTLAANDGAITQLQVLKGRLNAAYYNTSTTNTRTYYWNGASWTVGDNTAGATSDPSASVIFQGNIIVWTPGIGARYSADSAGWSAATNPNGHGGVVSAAASGYSGTTARCYIVEEAATGCILEYATDPLAGTYTDITKIPENTSRGGMIVAGSTVYFSGTDLTAIACTVYSYDGSSLGVVARVADNYVASTALFNGQPYFGMAKGGEIYTIVGGKWTLAFTINTSNPVLLTSFGGALWAAATVGSNTCFYRYDGSGWSQPHYTATATVGTPNVIAGYAQRVVMANTATGNTARMYEQSASSRVTAAQLEGPDTVYGVPGNRKPYLECALTHSALIASQTVQLRHKLDDGAEVTDGTNSDVGSTETVLRLPLDTVGTRLRPKWYLVNGAAQDLTVYGMRVRAIPYLNSGGSSGGAQARQVWEERLYLKQRPNNKWNDGVADSLDELQKLAALNELARSGRPFQAVGPFRNGTDPVHAMMAVFDPQVPMDIRIFETAAHGAGIWVPVRLLQAMGPVNGLLNGSFEQDAAGSAPTNWGAVGTFTTANVSTAVSAPAGTKVLAVAFDGSAGPAGRSQTISGLTAGRYYTAGCYIRRATTGGGTVRMNITGTGLDVGTPALAAATDTDFAWYEVSFQLPAGTTAITIKLVGESTPAGTCYFDGVRLEE